MLRDINLLSVCVRMILAFLCGGVIGLEREAKRKPAGLRTHILICLGACMTTMTGQFLVQVLHLFTDMARLGAQVVCGIGFIGAGVILFTRQRRVKGLTTAAGLWVCGIIGLTCGAGYYEAAITATVLVLLAELVLIKVEDKRMAAAQNVQIRVCCGQVRALNDVMSYLNDLDIEINALDVHKEENSSACSAELTMKLHRKILPRDLVADIGKLDGVLVVEEL